MSQLAVQQSQTSPSFILKVTQGPNKGDTFRILPPGVVIGRDPTSCQIALNDLRISRQHCRIDFTPEGVTIQDLAGKNTTLVNQQPVTHHALQHGDVIALGDTYILFHSGTVPAVRPATPPAFSKPAGADFFKKDPSGVAAPTQPPRNKTFYIVAAIVISALLYIVLSPEKAKGPPPKVVTPEAVDEAIVAVQKRQEELQKATSNMSEAELYNKRSAQKHYIRGFRDYQNQKYTRAIEAFQTTLATDPTHPQAKRYYRLAEKKRMDMIDQHMDLGLKYKEKLMYKMCIAEFEKVLQIINQPSNKKYQLAKEQIKECRLSLQGSF